MGDHDPVGKVRRTARDERYAWRKGDVVVVYVPPSPDELVEYRSPE